MVIIGAEDVIREYLPQPSGKNGSRSVERFRFLVAQYYAYHTAKRRVNELAAVFHYVAVHGLIAAIDDVAYHFVFRFVCL